MYVNQAPHVVHHKLTQYCVSIMFQQHWGENNSLYNKKEAGYNLGAQPFQFLINDKQGMHKAGES